MGCLSSKSNEVSPAGSAVKRPVSIDFEEKDITNSAKRLNNNYNYKNKNNKNVGDKKTQEIPYRPIKGI